MCGNLVLNSDPNSVQVHMAVKLDLICFSFLLRNEVEELLALAATVVLDKVCRCLILGFFMGGADDLKNRSGGLIENRMRADFNVQGKTSPLEHH